MVDSTSKDKILAKIRRIQQSRRMPVPDTTYDTGAIYKSILPNPLTCFKEEVESVSGQCILCRDEEDLNTRLLGFINARSFKYLFTIDETLNAKLKKQNVPIATSSQYFKDMQAAITTCEYLIARTGSVLVSTENMGSRLMHAYPSVHIVVANASQVVSYPGDALLALQEKYNSSLPSMITFITGPSRTADIEKTLVLGAHGPKELIIFVVENQ